MRTRWIFALVLLSCTMSSNSNATERPTPEIMSRYLNQALGTGLPAAWAGIWYGTVTLEECSGGVIQVGESCDTLSAGEPIEDPTLSCTSTVTDTEIHIHCTGTEGQDPCIADVTVDFDLVRAGDALTGTAVFVTDYRATCPYPEIYPDTCLRFELSQQRVAACPVSAAVPATWGRLKILYK